MDKNLFTNRLTQLGIKRQVDAAIVVSGAQKIINEKFGEQRGGDNLRAISYQKGVLKIAASSNAWAAECQGLVGSIKKLSVQRVIFVVGSLNEEN